MADYTTIKIFSISLDAASHPSTGTLVAIEELNVRDNGLSTLTLGYNIGGATGSDAGQSAQNRKTRTDGISA